MLEAWLCHIPGLKVVVPSCPADAKGLLLASIRADNPVVFIEPTSSYFTKGPSWRAFAGRNKLTGQGRPRLRLVACAGSTVRQSGLPGLLSAPIRQRDQQAEAHSGVGRDRSCDQAAPARQVPQLIDVLQSQRSGGDEYGHAPPLASRGRTKAALSDVPVRGLPQAPFPVSARTQDHAGQVAEVPLTAKFTRTILASNLEMITRGPIRRACQ
ncbi:MAG: hypothetical protein ACLQFR_02085 [Streptosporangiaceae bacterium]